MHGIYFTIVGIKHFQGSLTFVHPTVAHPKLKIRHLLTRHLLTHWHLLRRQLLINHCNSRQLPTLGCDERHLLTRHCMRQLLTLTTTFAHPYYMRHLLNRHHNFSDEIWRNLGEWSSLHTSRILSHRRQKNSFFIKFWEGPKFMKTFWFWSGFLHVILKLIHQKYYDMKAALTTFVREIWWSL